MTKIKEIKMMQNGKPVIHLYYQGKHIAIIEQCYDRKTFACGNIVGSKREVIKGVIAQNK